MDNKKMLSYQLMFAIKWMVFIQNNKPYNQAQIKYPFTCCRKEIPPFLKRRNIWKDWNWRDMAVKFLHTLEMSNNPCICRIMLCFIHLYWLLSFGIFWRLKQTPACWQVWHISAQALYILNGCFTHLEKFVAETEPARCTVQYMWQRGEDDFCSSGQQWDVWTDVKPNEVFPFFVNVSFLLTSCRPCNFCLVWLFIKHKVEIITQFFQTFLGNFIPIYYSNFWKLWSTGLI